MPVYIFLAEGFEEIETIAPIDILRRAAIETITVSISDSDIVMGAHNIPVIADKLYDELDYSDAEALILPGGQPGTTNLEKHLALRQLIIDSFNNGKLVSAICAAPSILGKLGLLQTKQVNCYPGYEKFLDGARLSEKKVIKDGKIITAKAAGVAIEFALELVATMKGKEVADNIKSAIFL
jgi:protein deglycase